MYASRSQCFGASILSLIAKSPADVGYWSDEWGVGGKSGAEIRFTSSFMLMHYL
ncbi:MAG: hypothetical protein ACYTXI_36780 [Nostoc sp.]